MKITKHGKIRIKERDEKTTSIAEAKKVAKIAFHSGKTIKDFQDFPKFHDYLIRKKEQASKCSVRVYRNNLYIWKGAKQTLVTMHPIPDKFIKELEAKENVNTAKSE